MIVPTSSARMGWAQTQTASSSPPQPLISTRGNFDNNTGELLSGHNSIDYNVTNIPGLRTGACPPELVIFAHGAYVDGKFLKTALENASEIFDRARMSLTNNSYTYPFAGFSWDSNTTISPVSWPALKLIAKENGPKLAQFILDYTEICKHRDNQDVKVRLIGHSLGARVVLSALQSLHNNQEWKNEKFKVTSVHLLGGAVDNEEVSKDSWDIVSDSTNFNGTFSIKFPYGNAIQDEVVKFYNLFDSADAALIALFPPAEHDNPLGLKGAQIGISLPSNYNQKDVKNMISPFCDANGDKRADLPFHKGDKVTIGQNHAGYYGFRNPADNKTLIDSGAMNTVVRDWNITLAAQKLSLSPSAICNSTG